MKKLLITLIFSLFFATASHAWTDVVVSLDRTLQWDNGQVMHIFKFDVTDDDDSSSGDLVLTTELIANTDQFSGNSTQRTNKVNELMKGVAGGLLYYVKYEPDGTAPPATESTITIDDETGCLIFSEIVTTAETAQGWRGDIDTDKLVPVTTFTIALTTLAASDRAYVYIWILR